MKSRSDVSNEVIHLTTTCSIKWKRRFEENDEIVADKFLVFLCVLEILSHFDFLTSFLLLALFIAGK